MGDEYQILHNESEIRNLKKIIYRLEREIDALKQWCVDHLYVEHTNTPNMEDV